MGLIDTMLELVSYDGKKYANFDEVVKDYTMRAFGSSEPTAAKPVAEAVVTDSVVQYDGSGNAVCVAKITAANKGFKVGATVVSNGKGDDKTKEKWVIREISDDGTTRLQLLDALGEPVAPKLDKKGDPKPGDPAIKTISVTDLCFRHKIVSTTVKLMEGYPGNEGKHSKGLQRDVWESRGRDCLHTLAVSMPDQPIRIHEKPTKAVYATEDIAEGKLTLVPCTRSVAYPDPSKATNLKSVPCTFAPDDIKVMLNPASTSKDFCCASWCVREAENDKDVNVAPVDHHVHLLPPSTKKLHASQSSIITATIPCLVSTRDIAKDEEVKMKKIKRAEPEKKLSALLVASGSASAAKRPKL